ncbi:uncharacterized protein KY384_008696 [Bacidia gigantensis]|uniref:uncharacterized protein n=1 Tax=Bacidia gigantensis TaxID=2732470 RepID=UPI001D046229|nr:uncharacterized protein KY384_008696 [Bacidia gigantensis]KAG8526496.1 hypothetical protein KY384_008696 [Bacidia gigantensis]
MENLANEAHASLKASHTPVEEKLRHLTALKQEIKHRSCPDRAIPTIFDVIRLSLAVPHVVDAGFSILGHLNRRLTLQNLPSTIHTYTVKLFPILHDRLGDPRDRIRERAITAFTDLYSVSEEASSDVERFVRDTALTSKHPRAKLSSMQWILQTHKEKGMLFRSFVPNIVNCLEDADGHVRKAAQESVIELFTMTSDTPLKSRQDLQKKMRERDVRKSIETHILVELEIDVRPREVNRFEQPPTPVSPPTGTPRVEFASKTHQDRRVPVSPGAQKRKLAPSKLSQTTNAISDEVPPPEAQPMSISQQEAASLTPVYIETSRDLEEFFREMQQWFEGKEAESNWLKREKSIEKLRRLIKGNAPQEYTTLFIANVKSMLDGILKAVNSLRTTLCTIGCHLVQDLARVCGPAMDGMVEILLQNLVKLCGNTKKIAANKANDTVTAIMQYVSYHNRLLQHIHMASQDKNAQPRTFACGWLRIVLSNHSTLKTNIEHTGGLELVEKSVKNGLNDSNPGVRESMRPVYWVFAKIWSERSEAIMAGLSQSHQDLLVKNSANPNPQQSTSTAAAAAAAAGPKSTFSKSAGAASTRPSIKETIAAQKRAKAANRDLPPRPGSAAESSVSPIKPAPPARPATSMSTTRQPSSHSIGTLSSAPVRPRRGLHTAKAPTESHVDTEIRRHKEPSWEELPLRPKADTPLPPIGAERDAEIKAQHDAMLASTRNTVKEEASSTRSAMPSSLMHDPEEVSDTRSKADNELVANTSNIPPKTAEKSLRKDQNQPHEESSWEEADKALPSIHSSVEVKQLDKHSPERSPKRPERISMSPRSVVSRKENMQPKSQTPKSLKVYEDPFPSGSTVASPIADTSSRPRALGELPVNEPTNKLRHTDDNNFKLNREEYQHGVPEHYNLEWRTLQKRQLSKVKHESDKMENPMLAQKILKSAIVRVQAQSLDIHGFRKLQSVIYFAPRAVWEEGYKVQEIMVPLLEHLETENDSEDILDVQKEIDLKTQILITIRMLYQEFEHELSSLHVQMLCSLIAARRFYNDTSHMVSGLQDTSEILADRVHPAEAVNAIVDVMRTEFDHRLRTMGCYVLAGLLHRIHLQGIVAGMLDYEGLGYIFYHTMKHTHPDVRRAAVEYGLELEHNVNPDQFRSFMSGLTDGMKGLFAYYQARHRLVHVT